jgi:hypothetical protein
MSSETDASKVTWEIEAELETFADGELLRVRNSEGRLALGRRYRDCQAPRDSSEFALLVGHALPHVAEIVTTDSNYTIIYDLPPTSSLMAELDYKRIPFDQGLKILWQVAETLQILHEHSLSYHQLRPENCVLLSDGSIRCLGAGLPCTPAQSDTTELAYTDPSATHAACDPSSDIYRFGVFGYHLATGDLPFTLKSKAELTARAPAPLPAIGKRASDWPPDFFDLIARCVNLNRNNRPASAYALLQALSRFSANTPIPRNAAATVAVNMTTRASRGINLSTGRSEVKWWEKMTASRSMTVILVCALVGALLFLYGQEDLSKVTHYTKSLLETRTLAVEDLPVGTYTGTLTIVPKQRELPFTIVREAEMAHLSFGTCLRSPLAIETGHFVCNTRDGILTLSSPPPTLKGTLNIFGKQFTFEAASMDHHAQRGS